MKSRPAALLYAVPLFLACSESTEPDGIWEVDFGLVGAPSSLNTLIMPDTVFVGRPVAVTVNTFGSSSCTRPAGIIQASAGARLQILTPLDSVAVRAIACTDDLASHPHPTVLTFQEAGTATVRVQGYIMLQGGQKRSGAVEKLVVVRP
ncbi:MAG TPA: hypothetical protein VJ717_15995 [Gemmatimonadaceae bacterium]|nr:hypothetical protein [Gemmatimonadaceae bacterium]